MSMMPTHCPCRRTVAVRIRFAFRIVIALFSVLAISCQTAEKPLTLAQAKQISLSFQAESFTPPPRSVEDLAALAAKVNVRVAIEVIPNPLSSALDLVRLIEEDLDGLDIGVCLDYGHAHLMGDLGEAIETLSGHLWTTHVHDNGGTRDDHLVPYAGTIDWDAAMMTTQKIGYDGVFMLEVGDTGDPVDVLVRSVKARERLEKTFVTF